MAVSRVFKKLFPKYSIFALIAMFTVNIATYYLTRPITCVLHHHSFALSIDNAVPFVPAFIIIYVLSYAQWGIMYWLITRDSEHLCHKVTASEITGKLICAVCFIIVPVAISRPEITGTDFCSYITRFIYTIDEPNNLFPSIHCMESWLCTRYAFKMQKGGKWLGITNLVFTVFVFMSVLFVKQHYFVDIPAGILTAELGIFISKKTGLANALEINYKKHKTQSERT